MMGWHLSWAGRAILAELTAGAKAWRHVDTCGSEQVPELLGGRGRGQGRGRGRQAGTGNGGCFY